MRCSICDKPLTHTDELECETCRECLQQISQSAQNIVDGVA